MQDDSSPLKLGKEPRFAYLGVALFGLGCLYPVLGLGRIGVAVWTITFWVVLISTIRATSGRRGIRAIARALGGLALAAGIAGYLSTEFGGVTHGAVRALVDLVTFAFLAFATAVVLYEVIRATEVTGDHLIGAAAAYVLLGLAFTYALLLLEAVSGEPILVTEGALSSIPHPPAEQLADYLYYSFITLTTTGFGDVVPATLGARVVAGMEAVTGQLYLTVLIARLIGLHVVHRSAHR